MKNLILLKNYLIIVLLTITSFDYAQDSSKIIILSKDVGMIVDSEERKEYEIFPSFSENFLNAVYYLSPDSQYYCSVKLKSGDSVIDSIINLSYTSIRNTAVRIQSLESKKKGNKDFDVQNVELKFADSKDVKNLTYEQVKIKFEKTNSLSLNRKLPTNRLDLNYSEIIERDFEFGLSAGLVYNTATFDGLAEIFNILEENISEEPYKIPKSNFTFKASPLFRFSSMLIFRNTIIGEIEYAFNSHSDDYSNLDYKTFAISISYILPLLKNPYPYVMLGYSAAKFTVIKNYGVPINDRQGSLESITLNGNATGLKTSIGIMYNFTPKVGVNFYGNYKFYTEVKINQQYYLQIQDFPTVNPNGFELGISLYLRM
jgi:hypothetical protein